MNRFTFLVVSMECHWRDIKDVSIDILSTESKPAQLCPEDLDKGDQSLVCHSSSVANEKARSIWLVGDGAP